MRGALAAERGNMFRVASSLRQSLRPLDNFMLAEVRVQVGLIIVGLDMRLQNIETCTSPPAATSINVVMFALQQSCKLHKICHSPCGAQTTK